VCPVLIDTSFFSYENDSDVENGSLRSIRPENGQDTGLYPSCTVQRTFLADGRSEEKFWREEMMAWWKKNQLPEGIKWR
jgi:hypothetical protein